MLDAILAQDNIKKVELLEYPELGMEAVWRIESPRLIAALRQALGVRLTEPHERPSATVRRIVNMTALIVAAAAAQRGEQKPLL